jgi:hypothetical protein
MGHIGDVNKNVYISNEIYCNNWWGSRKMGHIGDVNKTVYISNEIYCNNWWGSRVGVSHIYSRVAVTEVGYVFVQEWGFHIYIVE